MTHLNSALLLVNTLEESDLLSIASEQVIATSVALMVTVMVWYPCWKFTTTQQDMLIRVVANARALSLFILSHGMLTSSSFYSLGKTMVLKRIELVIYFMPFGFLTCLWRELRQIRNGLWCVLTNVLDSLSAGGKSSKNFTPSMKRKEEVAKQSKLNGCGIRSSILKLKQVLLICFTKIIVIPSRTNRI
jgi:hypothetical protein